MTRPSIGGIVETALYVDDMEASARFYRDTFGFETIIEGERLFALKIADRQILLLFKKGASRDLPQTAHDGEGQLHLAFSIASEALEAWAGWLADRGIEVVERKLWDEGGTSLYFRDPDGHILEVATPGVWPRVS